MHGNASVKDELISVGAPLPKITDVCALDQLLIEVCFRSGETRVVDVAPVLASKKLFAPLVQDDALFRQLAVNEDGNAVEWPGGIELSAVWISSLPALP